MKQKDKNHSAKKAPPKNTLKLPDLDQAKSAVINSLMSRQSQRGYAGMTGKVVWHVVKECARLAGIEKLAPHDLRRYLRPALPCCGRRA